MVKMAITNNDILWGLGELLLGIYFLWATRKYQTKGRDIWHLDFKGYFAGALFTISGLVIFINGFMHKVHFPTF